MSFTAVTAVTAGSASAATCPQQGQELQRAWRGAVFLRDGALWGCTAFFKDGDTVTRKLGAWGRGSQVAFDGRWATWTIRSGSGRRIRDRLTSVDVGTGAATFSNAAPVPGGDLDDGRVTALAAASYMAAWVTAKGTMVAAVPAQQRGPRTVGARGGNGAGLQQPLRTVGTRVIVGRWPGSAAAAARTLDVVNAGGAGDDCGGISTAVATVRPDAGAPRAGVSWDLRFRTGNC
ncbi:hypothetical protein Q5424_22690 [Conexibacter sp. JD483]|uniref:hypothetical protein n=1 Tax=unclassified Conexibacter TaxID=2627773 RepID=UPI00271B0D74|nr:MULTISPECIES: hypothetical protein [unclassified Conexibacter]MDO8188453.1 hypothetical protein [Conexibacter sp. CPCC 205706]MDO8199186.1 hypothetical protein [Conexibacter sp. CPCC 205762]MDR9371923.1 hypothetical protein [Conexibacter sp. JD483]